MKGWKCNETKNRQPERARHLRYPVHRLLPGKPVRANHHGHISVFELQKHWAYQVLEIPGVPDYGGFEQTKEGGGLVK